MTIYDAMQAGNQRKRAFKSLGAVEYVRSVYDLGSPGGSGMDLPPRLNAWHCRDCGKPVPSDRATCPHCSGGVKS